MLEQEVYRCQNEEEVAERRLRLLFVSLDGIQDTMKEEFTNVFVLLLPSCPAAVSAHVRLFFMSSCLTSCRSMTLRTAQSLNITMKTGDGNNYTGKKKLLNMT